MRCRPTRLVLVPTGLVLLVAVACGPSDPRVAVLQERARWDVDLLSWAADEDGSLSANVQVSGPPSSSLDRLTFRITLYGAGEQVLEHRWRTIDLEDVPRGAPKEMFFHLEPAAEPVEGLAIGLVLAPDPEQETHIVELQELGGDG